MKRLAFLAFLVPSLSFAQKIEENKVDEFTHHKIIRTSWEPIIKKFGNSIIGHVRVSKIDGDIYINLRIMRSGSAMAIDEGARLMIKTASDSIVTLNNLKYQISCTGCGAVGFAGSALQGLDLTFPMSDDQANYLLANKAVKLRIYLTDGYLEEEIKEKFAEILINELKLALNH